MSQKSKSILKQSFMNLKSDYYKKTSTELKNKLNNLHDCYLSANESINNLKGEINKLKEEKSDRSEVQAVKRTIDRNSILQVHHDMQMYVDSCINDIKSNSFKNNSDMILNETRRLIDERIHIDEISHLINRIDEIEKYIAKFTLEQSIKYEQKVIDPIKGNLLEYFKEEQKLFESKHNTSVNESETPGYYAIKASLFNDWIRNSSNDKRHYKSLSSSYDKLSSKKKALKQKVNLKTFELELPCSKIEDQKFDPNLSSFNIPSVKSYFPLDDQFISSFNTRNLNQIGENDRDVSTYKMKPVNKIKRVEIENQAFITQNKAGSALKYDHSDRK